MDFDVSNAEIVRLLHKPRGWIFDVSSSNFNGCVLWFPCGMRLNFFYDDFVVIKKTHGVKLSNVKLHLEFTAHGSGLYDNDTESEAADYKRQYTFTMKDFNIRRCDGGRYRKRN
ncbi:MAG: hypothetical protein L7F77_14145 [Candidatus Magnetominusculus sp. LBB02]|nr:hypothetical protein [Candidatus Magnetominusculus sp. LBB02]